MKTLFHTKRAASVLVLAVAVGVTAFVQTAFGHGSGTAGSSAPPDGTVTLCKSMGISCAGHWATVAGHRTYALAARFTIDGRGRLTPTAHAASSIGVLTNKGSGLCLSSYGTHTSGDPAYQAACNNSNNQTWWLSSQGIYGYEVHNTGDGWCLTNRGGAAYDGNWQTMWPCPSSQNYKEEYSYSSAGGITFYPRTANLQNNGYAVSSGGNNSPGSVVAEYAANRSANQTWAGTISCGGC